MKKLLSASIAALAFAALADTDYTPITVGVTTITPTVQNTVIPVQYTTIGSSENVSVHDLVKSANLPLNTMLYYFDGNNYKAWKNNSSGVWATTDISSTKIGDATVTAPTTEFHVSVGAALWVAFPDETTLNQQNIVLYGTPATATNSTIVVGTNLLANPTGAAVSGSDLAAKLASITPAKGDKITYLGGSGSYSGYFTYSGGWKKVVGKTITDGLDDLPANGGFWYVSKGGAGTINWASEP